MITYNDSIAEAGTLITLEPGESRWVRFWRWLSRGRWYPAPPIVTCDTMTITGVTHGAGHDYQEEA